MFVLKEEAKSYQSELTLLLKKRMIMVLNFPNLTLQKITVAFLKMKYKATIDNRNKSVYSYIPILFTYL